MTIAAELHRDISNYLSDTGNAAAIFLTCIAPSNSIMANWQSHCAIFGNWNPPPHPSSCLNCDKGFQKWRYGFSYLVYLVYSASETMPLIVAELSFIPLSTNGCALELEGTAFTFTSSCLWEATEEVHFRWGGSLGNSDDCSVWAQGL